jgi:hypothetical protein
MCGVAGIVAVCTTDSHVPALQNMLPPYSGADNCSVISSGKSLLAFGGSPVWSSSALARWCEVMHVHP